MVVTVNRGGAMISSGLDWRMDLRQVGPELWAELIEEYQLFCSRTLPNDCRNLLRMVSEAEYVGWAGYEDRETYIRDGLGLDPEAVDWALSGLQITGVDAPVGFEEAQKLGKHGGKRPGAGRKPKTDDNQDYPVNLISEPKASGNSRAYREAKAARDGKPISPRYPEKPLTVLRRAWRKATTAERTAFLAEIR